MNFALSMTGVHSNNFNHCSALRVAATEKSEQQFTQMQCCCIYRNFSLYSPLIEKYGYRDFGKGQKTKYR